MATHATRISVEAFTHVEATRRIIPTSETCKLKRGLDISIEICIG